MEIFCGAGNVANQVDNKFPGQSIGFDIESPNQIAPAEGPPTVYCDILTASGFRAAVVAIGAAAPNALIFFAPPCKSWVWFSAGIALLRVQLCMHVQAHLSRCLHPPPNTSASSSLTARMATPLKRSSPLATSASVARLSSSSCVVCSVVKSPLSSLRESQTHAHTHTHTHCPGRELHVQAQQNAEMRRTQQPCQAQREPRHLRRHFPEGPAAALNPVLVPCTLSSRAWCGVFALLCCLVARSSEVVQLVWHGCPGGHQPMWSAHSSDSRPLGPKATPAADASCRQVGATL